MSESTKVTIEVPETAEEARKLITTPYCELSPSYGRDYKNKAEVEVAFRAGHDFEGDYNLGFMLCSIRDFAKGVKVNLRYKKLQSVTVVTV